MTNPIETYFRDTRPKIWKKKIGSLEKNLEPFLEERMKHLEERFFDVGRCLGIDHERDVEIVGIWSEFDLPNVKYTLPNSSFIIVSDYILDITDIVVSAKSTESLDPLDLKELNLDKREGVFGGHFPKEFTFGSYVKNQQKFTTGFRSRLSFGAFLHHFKQTNRAVPRLNKQDLSKKFTR